MTQERRRGSENNLSGPRLSDNRSRSMNEPPILHDDPGRPDKWQPNQCDSCKVPATTVDLLTFELRLRGRTAGEWTLCGSCWAWRNDRRLDPDPRHVSEDAA